MRSLTARLALTFICLTIPMQAWAHGKYFTGSVKVTPEGTYLGGVLVGALTPAQRVSIAACSGPTLCEFELEMPTSGEVFSFISVSIIEPFRAPKDVLSAIYRRPAVWDANPFDVDDATAGNIYTSSLALLISKSNDKARSLQEQSPAHAPWLTAQEWDVRAVKIDVDDLGDGRALGIARYRNFAEEDPRPTVVTYDLQETPDGWRVADITFPASTHGANRKLSDRLKAYLGDASPAIAKSDALRPPVVSTPPAQSKPQADIYEQIFGPSPSTQKQTAAPFPPLVMPDATAQGAAPPAASSRAQSAAAPRREPTVRPPAFKPLVPQKPIVTLGRCHMGRCSWAKWLDVAVKPSGRHELQMDLRLLGGESRAESAGNDKIRWNDRPHMTKVTCSYSRPTISIDGQADVLPLRADDPVAGVYMSSENLYFAACHSDTNGSFDRSKKYGYNVQTED